jgi:hypothetical protein
MQPFKEEQSNKTTTTPYLCWLGISEITFNSATLDTMSSCDVVSSSSSQVDSFQGHWQVSSSPGRNLIGVLMDSKRIVLYDTTEAIITASKMHITSL